MNKTLKDLFTWDEHYERGMKWALVVAMWAVVFLEHSDIPLYYVWLKDNTPYGLLWVWLNPYYWTQAPYRLFILGVVILQTLVNWQFVKRKKMSKFMFYLGWFTSVIWISGGVYQNVTVTAFAPLASVYPILTIFLLLQKIPLGWSFPDVTANAHWQCAFNGTQPASDITSPTGLQCSAPDVRWNPFLPFFWSYAIIMFWAAYPLLVWADNKGYIKLALRKSKAFKSWVGKKMLCDCEECNARRAQSKIWRKEARMARAKKC